MATFTEHLGLHQWAAGDNFLRTDFNADFLAIDQAVHQAQTSLDGRIDTVNAALDTKIDTVNSTLDGKINTVNSTLNSKIDSTKTSLTNTINAEKQTLNNTITSTKNTLNNTITSVQNTLQAAIDKRCEVVTGTYTGDGQESRTISLGRAPDAVLLFDQYGRADIGYDSYGGLALAGYPCYKSGERSIPTITLTSSGFTVYYRRPSGSYSVLTNGSGVNYHYLAFFL